MEYFGRMFCALVVNGTDRRVAEQLASELRSRYEANHSDGRGRSLGRRLLGGRQAFSWI